MRCALVNPFRLSWGIDLTPRILAVHKCPWFRPRVRKGISADLHLPIEASILDRFGDVGGFDVFGAGEVGDGSAHF